MNLIPKLLPLVKHPNPILRTESQNVVRIGSEEIQQLITDMIYTMKSNNGIGLAAPQIGRNINLFVVDDGSGPQVYINPLIIFRSPRKNIVEEGCLSIPDVYGLVTRPECVWLIYKNRKGHIKLRRRTAMLARIIQHEYDHLRGRLFIDITDRITKGDELLQKYESTKPSV